MELEHWFDAMIEPIHLLQCRELADIYTDNITTGTICYGCDTYTPWTTKPVS